MSFPTIDEAGFAAFIRSERESTLTSYRARPDNIRENSGQEQAIIQGGYGRKQIQELVQNSVDAVDGADGRIHVVLTEKCLYVANNGKPFTREGITTLLHANMSDKRDDQIGRFGLGFKSVLEVSDRPQVFSRTGSFGFDAEASRHELSAIRPGLDHYPVLRLPLALNPAIEAGDDPVLAELFQWAATVVKLPLRTSGAALADQLRSFPRRFLLFTPKVATFTVDDRLTDGTVSCWIAERVKAEVNRAHVVKLTDGNATETWLVLDDFHRPSPKALESAGSQHARNELLVQWAVPVNVPGVGARSVGEAWNYFPTKLKLRMPGIVNAPFKMNDDRVSVLEDLYNGEIFSRTLPRLVIGSLPLLRTDDDPARHLDFMPARGREDSPWVRENIIEPVTTALTSVASLPDLDGNLRTVASLSVRPKSVDDDPASTSDWTAAASRAGVFGWLHESALSSTFRSALIDRLLEIVHSSRKDETAWVEGIAGPKSLEAYGEAILFAKKLIDRHLTDSRFIERVRSARVVLMNDASVGRLSERLFFPDSPDQADPGVIDVALYELDGVASVLKSFGAVSREGINQFRILLEDALESPQDEELAGKVWKTAQRFDRAEVLTVFDAKKAIPKGILVQVQNGSWRPFVKTWLNGALLDSRRAGDAGLVIKEGHPFLDKETCRQLGMRSTLPSQVRVLPDDAQEGWSDEARRRIQDEIVQDYGRGSGCKVAITTTTAVTPRLDEMAAASHEARAAVTRELLSRPQSPVKLDVEINYRPDGSSTYLTKRASFDYPGPDLRWVEKYGTLATKKYGYMPVSGCCRAVEGIPDELLPIPTGVDESKLTALLGPVKTMTGGRWDVVFKAAQSSLTGKDLQALYGHAAAASAPAPKSIYARVGDVDFQELPLSGCRVPVDAETEQHLLHHTDFGVVWTGVVVQDEALKHGWGIPEASIDFSVTVQYDPTTKKIPVETVGSRFPYLGKAGVRKFSKFKSFSLIPCASIELITSNDYDDIQSVGESSPIEVLEDEKEIYYRDSLRDEGLCGQISKFWGSKLSGTELMAIMRNVQQEAERDDLWVKLRKLKSDKDKVIYLLGESGLRDLVPEMALDLIEQSGEAVTTDLLYSLVQSAHGSRLWQIIIGSLPDEDTGAYLKKASRSDLKDLGFGDEFFGISVKSAPTREDFMGPTQLQALHDYQESAARKIVARLDARPGMNKGLLQLPTGSGKTRVAVESLIRFVKERRQEPNLIVWIAQSDELCEQAVEAWGQAWGALGIRGERLTVSRMWGSRKITSEMDSRVHVVVATIQTLSRVADRGAGTPGAEAYEWLQNPDVVVIDEAHGAVAKSYTTVLKWFRRATGMAGEPLLGLSATPFRGTSAEETERLVKRFDANLIQPDQFTAETAHSYLEAHGVLAHVRQEELGGTVLRRLPTSNSQSSTSGEDKSDILERRIDLESVARDQHRNARIIAHIEKNLGRIEHAIVFAASVEHAQALAAVLQARGIAAAAIHGGTDLSRRRRLIEEFRNGDIRVLTNFDVLTQGFDAPKVDTVYLCRPTFSPNKYIQMVGRGLRGPVNGGSEQVLVVNIKDNLQNFGEDLAYNEFQYLWEGTHA